MIRLFILGMFLGVSTIFYLAFENAAAASTLADIGPAGTVEGKVKNQFPAGPVSEVETYLAEEFCADTLCPEGEWRIWFLAEELEFWAVGEVEMVRTVLVHTMTALAEAGLDQQRLLRGYRFRRYAGEYIDGIEGKIAVVRHQRQEIILSDAAFLRLGGFYIYHELGHVVNQRLNQQLVLQFHLLAGSEVGQPTAEGYWLNQHAQNDWGESTADAFALWVGMRNGREMRPIFAGTSPTADYQAITEAMGRAVTLITSK